MHTSSAVDASDLYEEKVVKKDGNVLYEYDGSLREATKKSLQLFYIKNGERRNKVVTTFATASRTNHWTKKWKIAFA
jgi:hypothetical protein